MAVDFRRGDAGVPHDFGQQFDPAATKDKLRCERVARGLVPRDARELAGGQDCPESLPLRLSRKRSTTTS